MTYLCEHICLVLVITFNQWQTEVIKFSLKYNAAYNLNLEIH